MTALPLPFFEVTNWARPIVPPAPGIFVIWMRDARSSCWSASDIARAVWSAPDPGAAGTRISRPRISVPHANWMLFWIRNASPIAISSSCSTIIIGSRQQCRSERIADRRGNIARQHGIGSRPTAIVTDNADVEAELTELLQFPGVMRSGGVDGAALRAMALSLLDAVLDDFVAARGREGAGLAAAISERVEGIAAIAVQVRGLMPAIRAGQRQKLEVRLAELAQPADPGRLEQELVLSLQKLDVDEELDRLDTHVTELRRVLREDKPVGRRLDFLLQEFNREANTLGSKSVDARTSAAAVELKVLIDQVREQAQNIE